MTTVVLHYPVICAPLTLVVCISAVIRTSEYSSHSTTHCSSHSIKVISVYLALCRHGCNTTAVNADLVWGPSSNSVVCLPLCQCSSTVVCIRDGSSNTVDCLGNDFILDSNNSCRADWQHSVFELSPPNQGHPNQWWSNPCQSRSSMW